MASTRPRTMDLRFPAAGVVRRLGYRVSVDAGAPYPAPWALNVRLEDALTSRLRGGSWVAGASTAVPAPFFLHLATEAGEPIITEDGKLILVREVFSVPAGHSLQESHSGKCVYRDRLLLTEGAAILASRQGDHETWDFGGDVEDPGRAWAVQLSEAGERGGDVVALIPHRDRFLLGATADSLWAIHGDPAAEGTMRNVSRDVGIVAPRAWCKAGDAVYFLSARGLCVVAASGEDLRMLSHERVPEELSGITEDEDVVLEYDSAVHGVYIYLTDSPSWFYDIARNAFWPFDRTTANSHALMGPLRLGSPDRFGIVLNLHGMIAQESGPVTWRIVTGDTAEQAAENAKAAIEAFQAGTSYANHVKASGTWTAGRSLTAYPRVRAMWAVLWLQAAEPWAYENITMKTTQFGRWR